MLSPAADGSLSLVAAANLRAGDEILISYGAEKAFIFIYPFHFMFYQTTCLVGFFFVFCF